MALQLTYRATSSVPVEMEGFTPDAVRDQSLAEIEKFLIYRGNKQLPLAELFQITGDASDGRFDFQGDLSGVHWIGAHMKEGEIHLHGPVGRHLGSHMSGGEIHAQGDASDWVGGEMRGGLIRVAGNVGHLIGAAYRGSRKGMTGGTILIGGNAGNEVGHTMRRGWIVIGGQAGDMVGFNLIAGTVFLCGGCGIRPGAGMRRGTLAMLGGEIPRLLPTFKHNCRYRPLFMQVMLRQLAQLGFAFDPALMTTDFDLYSGDLVSVGKGEILIRPAA